MKKNVLIKATEEIHSNKNYTIRIGDKTNIYVTLNRKD